MKNWHSSIGSSMASLFALRKNNNIWQMDWSPGASQPGFRLLTSRFDQGQADRYEYGYNWQMALYVQSKCIMYKSFNTKYPSYQSWHHKYFPPIQTPKEQLHLSDVHHHLTVFGVLMLRKSSFTLAECVADSWRGISLVSYYWTKYDAIHCERVPLPMQRCMLSKNGVSNR
jgi:hypothetical protein